MRKEKAIAISLVLLVVAVCGWPLVAFDMRHYLPEVDNDEIMYFLLVKVFRSQGLHTGYSFINDHVPSGSVHFNAHGPGTVPLYGNLSRIVGWGNYSPYLANLLLFIPAWAVLVYALRRSPEKQLAAAFFVLAQGYFFIFLPSAMQESFHASIAIAAAGLWYAAIEREALAVWSVLLLLVTCAAFVRPTWGLAIPAITFWFALQRTDGRSWRIGRRVLVSAAISLAAGGVVTYAATRFVVSFALSSHSVPSSLTNVLNFAPIDTALLRSNVSTLVHLRVFPMFADYPKYFLVSLEVMLVIFLAGALAAPRHSQSQRASLCALILLGGSLAAQLMFSAVDGNKDFRTLAPAHALAGLVFVTHADALWDRWRPNWAAVTAFAAFLMTLNGVLTVHAVETKYSQNWNRQMAAIDESGKTAFGALSPYFESNVEDSAFCKTVYGDVEVVSDPRIIYLPGRVSLSMVEPELKQLPPLRGKYALARKNKEWVPSTGGTTRALLRSVGIDPSNHEAIIGAELTGRIPQGRLSGWADDDPDNPLLHQPPKFDWRQAFSSSSAWRRVAQSGDFTLFRSTVHCLTPEQSRQDG